VRERWIRVDEKPSESIDTRIELVASRPDRVSERKRCDRERSGSRRERPGSPCRRAAGPRTPLASVPPVSGSPAAIPAPTPVRRSISLDLSPRRGGRVVECTGLENQQAGEPRLEGSNPSPSVFEPRTASIWPLQTLNQPRHFRAVFAPVRPRAQRSQAVERRLRRHPTQGRGSLNHAESGSTKPKKRMALQDAVLGVWDFQDRRIQPLCHPSGGS
jgi:hypothetical protein